MGGALRSWADAQLAGGAANGPPQKPLPRQMELNQLQKAVKRVAVASQAHLM
jgi:hypothetical protein